MAKLTSLLFAAALALLPSKGKAEQPYYNNPRQIEFTEADAVVLSVNAGIGCAFAAAPSLVKGRKTTHTLENCLKGMLAGTFIYAGEKAASHAGTPGMGWTSHILMGNGASMRENVALGKGLFDRLAYDVGPFRLEWNARQKNQWHILPGSVVGIAANVAYESDWNERATLYSGTIVFDYYRQDGFLNSGQYFGATTTGNVITMNHAIPSRSRPGEYLAPRSQEDLALAYEHEQVHAAQYREFGSLDVVLRLSEGYRWTMDRTHLSLGSDVVIMALVNVPGGYPVAEWVPARLTINTLYTK